VARPRYPKTHGPLPPPLPPETRTVGQLVAETLRFYGEHFWPSLGLGLAVAAIDQATLGFSVDAQTAILWAGGVLLTASYVAAARLVRGSPAPLGAAFVAGLIVFLPAPILFRLYVLPVLVWFALVGLAVPAAVFEGLGGRAALRRGARLAAADWVHAIGSVVTLAVVYVLTRAILVLLLHSQGDATKRGAVFLADLALSPLLFLGPALLYVDQAARLRSGTRTRSRDADLHHAVNADAAGAPDPQREPRPAARSQP
jgi:hypothetical protein